LHRQSTQHVRGEQGSVQRPNELRISCKLPALRAHASVSGTYVRKLAPRKLTCPCLVEVTDFVEERGAIQDPVDLRLGPPPDGASLRHDEHRDVPFTKKEIKSVGVLAHHRV
jgi:hypothetical protein